MFLLSGEPETAFKRGFELVPFSPLHDKKLPEHISGLLLGGGYPELFAKELSENDSMKTAIREAIRGGLPSLAECGGFLYLHKSLKDMEGRQYSMAGVIDADADYRGKLVRFGYVELTEKESCFLPEKEEIRGHEFHYFDSTENGTDCVAKNRSEAEGGNVSGKEKTTGGDFLIFIIRPTLLL